MMRWLRRMLWLSVLVGIGFGGYQAWSRRRAVPVSAPEWPPLQPASGGSAPKADEAVAGESADSDSRWMPPVDGQCPDGYPLKANDNSGIFHVPGGRFYERTVAERCYASADDAIADGYRQAKA